MHENKLMCSQFIQIRRDLACELKPLKFGLTSFPKFFQQQHVRFKKSSFKTPKNIGCTLRSGDGITINQAFTMVGNQFTVNHHRESGCGKFIL